LREFRAAIVYVALVPNLLKPSPGGRINVLDLVEHQSARALNEMLLDRRAGSHRLFVWPAHEAPSNFQGYRFTTAPDLADEHHARCDREPGVVDMREADRERTDNAHVLRHRHIGLENTLDQAGRIVPLGVILNGCVVAWVRWGWWRIGLEVVSVGFGQ